MQHSHLLSAETPWQTAQVVRRWSTVCTLAVVFVALLTIPARAEPGAGPDEARLRRARSAFVNGLKDYRAGRLDQALAKFLRAHKAAPSAELIFNIARVYERMGDADKGIRFFRRYLKEGKPDEAERADIERRIAVLEKLRTRRQALALAPPPSSHQLAAEARTFFVRGVKLYKRRQYQAALVAFTAAQRFSKLPEIYYNLALISERLDRKRDAIDFYRAYLRAREDAPDRDRVLARIEKLRR